ncbi:hypothetical protein SAMN04490189_0751 [Pseudomonas koreensis]|uniref:hypothetical protein n=1 Tax=Pseudomonas koreensis TaxID=198620 RepID=UPI00087AED4A|nr:hypothetical protein [Pseudomonas koreensis]KAB0510670.1 hypothetical protein F7R05_24035 [Pseudomonas koreensis]NNA59605.1 hypothetical protein [Pseudomonas koreensis]GGK43487.1 hypothetical protein GCM10009103_42670 [Pseudomonas koreensis]SDC86238.1 hypothetical protein SAMN04490189_0751 [Pseudomonas koreensis]
MVAKSAPEKRIKRPLPEKARKVDVKGPALDLPEGVSQEIDPSCLLLDPHNLRLLERLGETYKDLNVKLFGQPSIQDKLFEIVNREPRFDIASLSASIANNGFLKHERLIVAKYDGDKFLVLEGNRRVTAVRRLINDPGTYDKLRPQVKETLRTLPCFVLEGPVIDGNVEQLEAYRRASEIYIGMRHLMGAKSWEPASRYEFQSRLIFEDGWSVVQVAERFGRKKAEVLRDLKAHVLYKDFVSFEKRILIKHTLTYNAFSEAARAPAISKWLGWSERDMSYLDKDNEEVFFHYLLNKLTDASGETEDLEDNNAVEVSAELAVRRLREMLKLEDSSVLEALSDRDFRSAEIFFEERKEGELPKKIAMFTRTLKRTTTDDLTESPETQQKLEELKVQVTKMLAIINALSGVSHGVN